MKIKYLITLAALVFLALKPAPTFAAGSCQLLFNGGSTCNQQGNNLSIDKTVQNPHNKEYTATLPKDEYLFSQGEIIPFQLKLKNISNNSISNITITDTLPPNIDYTGGDGIYNPTKHTITFKLSMLAKNNTQLYSYQTTVNNSALPGNQSTACLLNSVSVQTTSFFFFTTQQTQNTAAFCITSQSKMSNLTVGTPTLTINQPHQQLSVLPAIRNGRVYTAPKTKSSPATGPEAASIIILPMMAYIGGKLRNLKK